MYIKVYYNIGRIDSMIRKIRKIIFIVVLLMLGMIVVKGATIDRNLTLMPKQVFDKFTTKEETLKIVYVLML